MTNRELLTTAIIAFDLMVKDCIEHDRRGEDFHPVSQHVLAYLDQLIRNKPGLDHNRQQYLLNVSEIAGDIIRIFLSSTIDDEDLHIMLELQAERLRWLGSNLKTGESDRTTAH